MSILDFPPVLKTRRNHALEHATIHMLSQKYPRRRFAGHSNPTGFVVFGNASIEDIADAAVEALSRLRAGQSGLAIHPGCGTNYLISGLVGGTIAWLAMSGAKSWRSRLWRLPFVVLFSVFGSILAQPLGPLAQARLTTQPDPGNLEIVEVRPLPIGPGTGFQVQTRGAA
jgi:hypothetical protein